MVCKNKREGKQSAAQAMLKVTVLVTTCVLHSGLHQGAVLYSNNLLSCPFLSQKWIPKYLLGVVVMSWSLYLILLFCWCSCVHSHDHHKWLAEGLILIRLYLLYGPNFECINVIYIDMLCFVFPEQQLHPHIYSLGALLRLYGRSSWKSVKEKKVYYLLNQSSWAQISVNNCL